MNNQKKYDIFISYRRDGGDLSAKIIYDELVKAGYSVFFDVESLRSGLFNKELFSRIDDCLDFILILPPHALDRCESEDDWVRLEIEHAMAKGKNIIPISLRGFSFPDKDKLPESLSELQYYNRIEANNENFNRSISNLLSFLKSESKKKKTRKPILLTVVGIIVITTIILLAIFIINSRSGSQSIDPSENNTNVASANTVESDQMPTGTYEELLKRTFENDGENGHFSSYVLFPARAKVVAASMGFDSLCDFNNSEIFYYKEDEEFGYVVGLTTPTSINNRNALMYFLNGNEDIILSLPNLDESELPDAQKIAEIFTCGVYNSTIPGLSVFLSDDETYQWEIISDQNYSL